ncbi:MAG TPA: DUF4291 domain-containing protein [Planctomycetaceae bacterium]|nr:DUF4291 domain-containing protein [Planctomycetaceae bacterium]
MKYLKQIRADFNRNSIVVYQAYRDNIAKPTLEKGRFVAPFSWNRMTWIKPSFLWMMARSNWAQKSGQENVLAIRISREGWEKALSLGVLTSFEPCTHINPNQWREHFEQSEVHIQWDPERTIHGKKLDQRSIQVGLSRHVIKEFTEDWILEIVDYTPLVNKIRSLYLQGETSRAKKLLPQEKVYPIKESIAKSLGML